MSVLQPEPWVCGEVGLRNFCLWFQNWQSLMCGGVYWEILQLVMCRKVIVFYNCLFSRKYFPFRQDFQHAASLSFLLFIIRRIFLSHQSFIIPMSKELGRVLFPFFLQLTSYDTTDYPELHSQATFSYCVLFRCITFLWSKITEKNKHSSRFYQQVSQQWQEGRDKFGFFSVPSNKNHQWNKNFTFAA